MSIRPKIYPSIDLYPRGVKVPKCPKCGCVGTNDYKCLDCGEDMLELVKQAYAAATPR